MDSLRSFPGLGPLTIFLVVAVVAAAPTVPSFRCDFAFRRRQRHHSLYTLSPSNDIRAPSLPGYQDQALSDDTAQFGLYRPFVNHVWDQVISRYKLHIIPTDAVATTASPGGNSTNVVQVEIRAARGDPKMSIDAPIEYVRVALLETVDPSPQLVADPISVAPSSISTTGIQVMNIVIFPKVPHFPVWSADFVTLPGGKHLLLLDVQPMMSQQEERGPAADPNFALYQEHWKDQWYSPQDIANRFAWGGDLPPPVQKFVSPYCLWTRLQPLPSSTITGATDPIQTIQGPVWDAFVDHFHLYLQWLSSQRATNQGDAPNHREEYIQYRLDNDPAKPMLKRLYGGEWTARVLANYLFPLNLSVVGMVD
jgi:Ferredoxin-dependent bilin reductase